MMRTAQRFVAALLPVAVCAGCASSGASYLPASSESHAADQVQDFEGGSATLSPGEMRLRPQVCQGINLRPEYKTLDDGALAEFLRAQGFQPVKVRERSDLIYYDIQTGEGKTVRLRVAILPSAEEAGRELHEAILQHGPGAWGIHRANLAVLCPIGTPRSIIDFATQSKLACWGVLTVAGRDDTFVVPGGYREL